MKSKTPVGDQGKKKSPIRWEAVIPITIIFAAVFAYFHFMFDLNLRHGLEFIGTKVNGAEVNIDAINTSFWRASLRIHKIQMTNAENPTHNKIQIEEIRWGMLWDALLRGKIAIEEASISNIQLDVPRRTPGRVLPKEPPPTSDSAFDKMKADALNKIEGEYSQNVFGDVAAILNGVDPSAQLQGVQDNLASSARIKALQEELKMKEQEWKKRIESLPQGKDLQAYNDRIKALKFDAGNPAELQKSIQEAGNIIREVDSKIKEVQSTGQALNGDFNNYQNALKDLEAMVQKDIKDIEARLKIPKLDVESLSKMIFGPKVMSQLRQAERYMTLARQYMPPAKSAEQKAAEAAAKPTPHERANGKNYKFGRPRAYPLFWLKLAKISSSSSSGEFAGNVRGEIHNLTDDPPTLGLPTTIDFSGDFPKQSVRSVTGKITLDHRTEHPREEAHIAAQHDLSSYNLVSTPDVTLGLERATADSQLNLVLQQLNVDLSVQSQFSQANYQVAAKQEILQSLLKGVVGGLPNISAKAQVSGTWTALGFSVDSNLGRELQKGFERELQAKIAEAKKKIQSLIDEKIGGEKAKLLADFNKQRDQISGILKQKESEINKAKSSIEQSKNDGQKSGQKKIENEVQKGVQDLKKKFGF